MEKDDHPIFIFQKMENIAFTEYCKNHFFEQKKITYLVSSSYPIDQDMSFYLRRPINIPQFKTYLNEIFHPNQTENKEEKVSSKKIQGKQLSGNVLIADDSSDGQLILKLFLKSTNLTVEFASDGKEALSKFKEKKYDLVLMDMQMPIMDGLESTALIRQFEKENHYDPTPILALTAYAFKDEKEKTIAAGCNDHISKPIVKAKLLDILKDYI
jgi:CheY-like chemotaxis protein